MYIPPVEAKPLLYPKSSNILCISLTVVVFPLVPVTDIIGISFTFLLILSKTL